MAVLKKRSSLSCPAVGDEEKSFHNVATCFQIGEKLSKFFAESDDSNPTDFVQLVLELLADGSLEELHSR